MLTKRSAAFLVSTIFAGATAFAATSPIPLSLAVGSPLTSNSAVDYIGSFSFPAENLICPPGAVGCGGGFQATINAGPTQSSNLATLTTVWCVDYQLDVGPGNAYTADVTTLANITTPTDPYVRYGTLNGTSSHGWVNALSDASNIEGGPDSARYRYTLAAALVSDYQNTPTTVTNSAVNQAIQEAAWYITYNTQYQTGATWPPFAMDTSACNGWSVNSTNYNCWLDRAESQVQSGEVDLNAWAVVSGPADAAGTLLDPVNSSYQTLLVQVVTPEPAYEALVLLGAGSFVFFFVLRPRRPQL